MSNVGTIVQIIGAVIDADFSNAANIPSIYSALEVSYLDTLISQAAELGIRLLLCLTNYWEDYGARLCFSQLSLVFEISRFCLSLYIDSSATKRNGHANA